MRKTITKAYSRYANDAVRILAGEIKATRLERRITRQELSERAGVSRDFLYRLENGDPACKIGTVFEIAAILGIHLFQLNHEDLAIRGKNIENKLALLPNRARIKKVNIDNDF